MLLKKSVSFIETVLYDTGSGVNEVLESLLEDGMDTGLLSVDVNIFQETPLFEDHIVPDVSPM